MAERAWSVGKTRQAATASRRAVSGSAGREGKAFRGELAGQGDGVLPGALAAASVHGDPGGADGDHGQGQQAGDHAAPPPGAATRGVVSGAQERLAGGG